MCGRHTFPHCASLLAVLLRLGQHRALAAEELRGGCVAGDETSRLRCELDEARALLSRQRLALQALRRDHTAELERKDSLIKALQEKDARLAQKEALIKGPDFWTANLGKRSAREELWQASRRSPGPSAQTVWKKHANPSRRSHLHVVVEEDHHRRTLATADLPTIIAALPVNTTRIDLIRGGFTGTLPADLGRFSHLEYLDLSYNSITGTVPPDLFNLTHLAVLRLAGNRLEGTVPAELGRLTLLTDLRLSTSGLTGTIPPELGQLTRLTQLELFSMGLTGTIPPELGKLTQLTIMYLSLNGLTGTIPRDIGNLSSLAILLLDQNHLSGSIPPELGKLTQLTILQLYTNMLTGTVPPELGELAQLQILTLAKNALTGPIPSELGNLVNLQGFVMGQNQLNGTIPPELGNLTQLQALLLDGNQLTGTIPPELGNLTLLTDLLLSSNQLTGPIPKQFGNLVNLMILYLQQNQLSSTLPNELGSLTSLGTLFVADNALSGTLPEAIVQLPALTILDVSDNPGLTGTFPDTTSSNLPMISAAGCGFTSAGAVGASVFLISFANNKLTELPAEWVNLPGVRVLDISNNRIGTWRPHGVIPSWALGYIIATCGIGPLEPRLNWPVIQSVNLTGNPLGQNSTLRDFIWSLAYLTSLSELFASSCGLQGAVSLDYTRSFAADMEDTGVCGGDVVRYVQGFRGLLTLDLSDNNITAIAPPPPDRLSSADLHSNPLVELDTKWYSTPNNLEVWNTSLRADVAPPSKASGCPTRGAEALEADPYGFVAKPGEDAFQCTTLCAGVKARYTHDASLNVSSLCRCTVGRGGAATACTGCPADTYSDTKDQWAMVRTCRPCPERSSTDGVENASDVEQCKCQAGWYMEKPAAGAADATPACKRCKQGRFMDTLPGATQEQQCICNASYAGLRELLGLCGCADGLYMDHVSRACRRCDTVAEDCTWGSDIKRSLLPPVIKASYWAAPPPELGLDDDEASTFAKHDIWRCFSKDTCLENGTCAVGRFGTACSLCVEGMYGGPDGPCRPCPYSPKDSRKNLLYVLLVGPAATIAGHALLNIRAGKLASTLASMRTSAKQCLKYLQMLGVMAGFHIDWPPLARKFLTEVPRITVALPQVAGVACLTGQQTATLEMGFRWLMPVAGLLSACLGAVLVAPTRFFGRKSRCYELLHMSYWDVLRVSLWGLALFYSTLLQFGTQVLACTHGPNGLTTVATFPHLQCGGGGEWAQLAAISSAFLLVFVGAVFLGIYVAWRRATRALVESNFESSGWWGFIFDDYRDGWGHWLMFTMAKDAALVVIATSGASDGPSQLLATAILSTLYSYVVLRDQPFRDPSNNIVEAWTMMSVGLLSLFTAAMGFQSAPGVADNTAMYPDGDSDPQYRRRDRALLAAQCLTFVGPAGIVLYQLLCASETVRKRLPASLRQPTEEERTHWNKDFFKSVKLDEATATDLWGVIDRLDVVDTARFRDLMSTSTATIGTVPSNASGINVKRMVRKRFLDVAKASGNSKASVSSENLQSSRDTGHQPVAVPAATCTDVRLVLTAGLEADGKVVIL